MLVTLSRLDRTRPMVWRVIDKRDQVQFSDRAGPWLLVVPAGRPPCDAGAKWVHGLLDATHRVMLGRAD